MISDACDKATEGTVRADTLDIQLVEHKYYVSAHLTIAYVSAAEDLDTGVN